MTESMSIGSMIVSAGFADYAMCLTSSHFCSSEIQFRNPLEYGGQRTPSAQWTVTGAGCAILSSKGTGPKICLLYTSVVNIRRSVTLWYGICLLRTRLVRSAAACSLKSKAETVRFSAIMKIANMRES